MKQRLHTILLLFAIVALSMAGTGCVEPLESDTTETLKIPIRIYLPSVAAATKGTETGPVAGSSAESALHQLQIWAFSHPGSDDEYPRAYLFADNLNFTDWKNDDGTVKTMTVYMSITNASVMRSPQKLDFYVLGNGHTVGGPLDAGLTRGEIRAKMISDADGFSTSSPVTYLNNGLPMSGYFDNWRQGFDISFLQSMKFPSEEELAEQGIVWPKVDITRAVSRMRFVFSQATGLDANAVHRIELFDYDQSASESQGVILKETYLFPREPSTPDPWPASPEYQRVSWGGNDYSSALLRSSEIPKITDPKALRSDSKAMQGMSAQYYENFLNSEIQKRHAVEKVIYLRESNKPIKGRIYYSTGSSEEKSVTFSMEGLENTTFERNHSWTVYAYFVGNHMEVTTLVQPWDKVDTEEVKPQEPVVVDQDGKFQITQLNNGTISGKTVTVDETGVACRLVIYAPVGGKLIIKPVPIGETTEQQMNELFEVSPQETQILSREDTPSGKTPGEIIVTVKRKPNIEKSTAVDRFMQLKFLVQVQVGEGASADTRIIDATSEVVDDEYFFSTPAAVETSNP